MTTTPNDTTSTPHMGTLAALRTVAVDPSRSVTGMFYAADCQARMLRNLLSHQANKILAHLSDLIPSILVEYIDNLPMPGTAFWGNNHWHIHVQTSAPEEVQAFTVLHELKHIIDHPLRQQPSSLGNADWEALADYFAERVLAQEMRPGRDSVIKRDIEISNTPTTLHDSPSQPTRQEVHDDQRC